MDGHNAETTKALEALAAMGEWRLGLKVANRRILRLNGRILGNWDCDRNEFAGRSE
jgi:hypothetical protein